jgi:spore coat polysaccharide biosynthesis protein SpsF (cytidylyltransferase family)
MSKTAVIIQARTGSTRLPNKMALPFDGERPVLAVLLGRISSALVDTDARIIVATTTDKRDDQIEDIARKEGLEVFRGSESDVLDRFIRAAESIGAHKVIRVCADNVFLDMENLKILYNLLDTDTSHDYVSFRKSDGTPSIKTHYGFWTEGVTLDALKKAAGMTSDKLYHEHVTNFIYTHPDEFACSFIQIDPEVEKHENLRLTMDTEDDYIVQRAIYSDVKGDERKMTPKSLIDYLEGHREYYETMSRTIMNNTK